MKKVFISVLTYNDNTATNNLLKSLEGIKKDGFDLFVVVVDNASVDMFKQSQDYNNFTLTVLRNEDNLGFSGGQNKGIEFSLENGADYVVVLNNDTFADPDLIINMLNAFTPNVGAVSPKIYFAKGHEYHKDRYKESELGRVFWYAGGFIDWSNVIGTHRGVDEVDKGQYESTEETEVCTGCCMMIERSVLEKVGNFDNKFFLYYEDGDLSIRMSKAGFKLMYAPKAILWHLNAAATGGSGSALQDYYITRNRMMFGFRYASLKVKFALFRESLRFLVNGRKWQKIGVKDFYLGNFGKGPYRA